MHDYYYDHAAMRKGTITFGTFRLVHVLCVACYVYYHNIEFVVANVIRKYTGTSYCSAVPFVCIYIVLTAKLNSALGVIKQ